jgi:hypothetical protein
MLSKTKTPTKKNLDFTKILKYLLSLGYLPIDNDYEFFLSSDGSMLICLNGSIMLCRRNIKLGKNAYTLIIDDISFTLMKNMLKKI